MLKEAEEKASDIFPYLALCLLKDVCYFSALRRLVFFYFFFQKQTSSLSLKRSAMSMWHDRAVGKDVVGVNSLRDTGSTASHCVSMLLDSHIIRYPLNQRHHTWQKCWKWLSWHQMLCPSKWHMHSEGLFSSPDSESWSVNQADSWWINLLILLICMIKVAL